MPRALTSSLLSVPRAPLGANLAFLPAFLNWVIKTPVPSRATTKWAPQSNVLCRLGAEAGAFGLSPGSGCI